jgi:hypothetical protein
MSQHLYELTEEHKMLRDMVRRLAKEQVAPGAARRDETGEFDWDMVNLLRENGLYGIDFPVEYGGSGAGVLAMATTNSDRFLFFLPQTKSKRKNIFQNLQPVNGLLLSL